MIRPRRPPTLETLLANPRAAAGVPERAVARLLRDVATTRAVLHEIEQRLRGRIPPSSRTMRLVRRLMFRRRPRAWGAW